MREELSWTVRLHTFDLFCMHNIGLFWRQGGNIWGEKACDISKFFALPHVRRQLLKRIELHRDIDLQQPHLLCCDLLWQSSLRWPRLRNEGNHFSTFSYTFQDALQGKHPRGRSHQGDVGQFSFLGLTADTFDKSQSHLRETDADLEARVGLLKPVLLDTVSSSTP